MADIELADCLWQVYWASRIAVCQCQNWWIMEFWNNWSCKLWQLLDILNLVGKAPY